MGKKLMAHILTATLALSANSYLYSKQEKVALTSRFLQIIDGAFLTGEVVGITLQIRKKLIEMAEGKRQPDGTLKGTYTFNGRNYCIRELAKIEHELFKSQEQLEAHTKTAQTDSEIQELSNQLKGIERQIKSLNAILEIAKKEFQDAVCIFLSQARNAKEPVIMLIDEYCEKSNRTNSLLLDWARLNDDEEESFNKQVTSFDIFYTFINDLTNFLESMVRGCPKAQQQLKKLMIQKSKRTK